MAEDSVERHSRDSEREGPREALRPICLEGGGSLEKQITMAVTLSTELMSKLACTCMHDTKAEGLSGLKERCWLHRLFMYIKIARC